MQRIIKTELLDTLPAENEQAMRSRADLRRINGLMGNVRILRRLLEATGQFYGAKRLVDLGAGDGTFLLSLVRQLRPVLAKKCAIAVDQKLSATSQTVGAFTRIGSAIEFVVADVFQWLMEERDGERTALIANLFLHHFDDTSLRRLMHLAHKQCCVFVACEPRRSVLSLGASALLGLIDCNFVTRHDAVCSVRAGFARRELSALWPQNDAWKLCEGPAGLFSHFFLAARKDL